MKVLYNGEIMDEEKASLPVSEKAVWYDFGVYESIKVIRGKIFHPEKHTERFFNSAREIDMSLGFTAEEVLSWLHKYVKETNVKDGLLRLFAYGDTDENKKAKIFLFSLGLTFYPDKFYKQGVIAVTYKGERFLPHSKSFNMLVNFMAFRKARKEGALEAILIDHNSLVTEGTRSNLFIVEKGKVITPPQEQVLCGVTRYFLIAWAKENNIKIFEENISEERLFNADEVFITSTSMNVMPIITIDGKYIKEGKVGELSKNLNLLFRKEQKKYLETQES